MNPRVGYPIETTKENNREDELGLGLRRARLAPVLELILSPYLLSFHPRLARGSIKSRLSLGALGNISDNQLTASLLKTTQNPT